MLEPRPGETVQNERVYAYVGPDESAALAAYDATVAKWDVMYADVSPTVA